MEIQYRCRQEYTKQKYLSKDIWLIWEVELKRTLSSPLYCREWPKLKVEFEAFPEFLKYIENIQKKLVANNLLHQSAKICAPGNNMAKDTCCYISDTLESAQK